MSDYEQYLLQQQAEQSPRHNDMTLDERMTEYIEWQNTDFDRDLMVDAHLEIIKLRRERDNLTAELAAARELAKRLTEDIELIADDYYPDGDDTAALALSEMRLALMAMLTEDGE